MDVIILYVAVGFVAQLVDGAIGMAYGLTASSVLLASGLPPTAVSAAVHGAEVFTTAVSGLAHRRQGNFSREIVVRLAVPGVVGGALGAWLLTSIPVDIVRPLVSTYLLTMGLFVLVKALRPHPPRPHSLSPLPPLAFLGSIVDAIGGGGWGPIVTSSMVGWGVPPRIAVGSSNCAEFFVTVVIAGVLLPELDQHVWSVVAGLVVGGILAAPLAAHAVKHVPVRLLMALVGIAVIGLSLNDLSRAWARFL
jgi:uncharacterized membrane protein YfcA